MKKLRLLLADDHRLFRDGLRNLLEQQPDIEVISEATDGQETLTAIKIFKFDIVLLDVSMPGLNGIETVRKLKQDYPSVQVIMLSMHSDQRFVIESLRAGAIGYVVKDSSIDELLSAIRAAANGQVYLSQVLASSVIKNYLNIISNQTNSAFSVLSTREREVLQLLAEGKSTKEIAANMNVSIKTIETHRKQIMDKLNIHSIAELTKYAIREGLTPLE